MLMFVLFVMCMGFGVDKDQFGVLSSDVSIEIYNSAKMLINYFRRNAESRTPDALLGIRFFKLQLENSHCGEKGLSVLVENTQLRIKELCNYVEGLLSLDTDTKLNDINAGSSFSEIVISRLSNSDFWQQSYGVKTNIKLPKSLTSLTSFDELKQKIDIGTPSAISSDSCLAEVLNPFSCSVSRKCLSEMMVERESHGYHLTHKLLYYILLNQRNCSASLLPDTMPTILISKLCSDILVESRLIDDRNFPTNYRDLFIEQVFLCSFSGYPEFLQKKWIKNILSWQNTNYGCYQFFLQPNDDDYGKAKRNAIQLENECSDHMSGLALAVMGAVIQFSIEMECAEAEIF